MLRPRVSRWLNHSCGRLPGNTTAARNIKDMVVVAPFATRHKRYNHRRLSCDQQSCIAMAASRSRPRDAMKNIWLVVAWCDLASLVAVNLRCHCFLRYDVPRYARCRLFCGQPRTSVLKADCCEGHTHHKPGVCYCSDSTLRKRGSGRCYPAIVVNTTTTMALISAVNDVVASIVAKSNLAAFFFARFLDCHRPLRYDIKKIRSLQSLLVIRRVKTRPCHRFSRE